MDTRKPVADYGEGMNTGDANVRFRSTSPVAEVQRDESDSQPTLKRRLLEDETEEGSESKRMRDKDNEDSTIACKDSDVGAAEESDDNDPQDWKNEITQLSESVFVYKNRNLSDHRNVFEGEIRSGVYGVRACAIKIDRKSKQIVGEAGILSKINPHTHVISILESGIYGSMFEECVYIVLDKCHEHNLHHHITYQNESGVEFNLNEALEYSKQIIAGVTFVHEKLIIHKDLKPSNILLSESKSTIKLADFGSSQEIKSTSSRVYSKHQFGTNGFRPVESFGDNWVSLKSDIFSLGAVFYFVLSGGKSPFGSVNSLWAYNIQNAEIDLSHLLVSNTKTFQHLIKLMLSKERCRRPSIWQVTDHPCWTGKKHECKFDYGFTEEIDDADVKALAQRKQDPSDSESKIESRRQLLRALHKMGYHIPPVTKTSIVIFDLKSKHLHCLNPRNKTVTRMHKYTDEMKKNFFTSVSIGDHIYILMIDGSTEDRTTYRLKYCDVSATWERMADLSDDYGWYPPAVVASESIFLAGGSFRIFTKSATKFDPLLNRWEKLKDKQLKTRGSTNVASRGFVYCLGGLIEGMVATDRVERLNVVSQSWDEVASMPEAKSYASAVACGGNVFVVGGRNRDSEVVNSVEKYDPDVNQWTIMKPMTMKRRYFFRCLSIDGNVYAIARDGFEKYHVEKDEWEIVRVPEAENLDIYESITVKMEK